MPDRSAGPATALLPVSVKDKESKPKEEHHRLLNGNSAEANNDWVITVPPPFRK